jgi:hypothetical protein
MRVSAQTLTHFFTLVTFHDTKEYRIRKTLFVFWFYPFPSFDYIYDICGTIQFPSTWQKYATCQTIRYFRASTDLFDLLSMTICYRQLNCWLLIYAIATLHTLEKRLCRQYWLVDKKSSFSSEKGNYFVVNFYKCSKFLSTTFVTHLIFSRRQHYNFVR